ncbi:hypothetical protein FACS1894204_10370 [Synergistales bacterium]|nr:hypothetical protein FACS1894204_10370 [Synergistales bacterium]
MSLRKSAHLIIAAIILISCQHATEALADSLGKRIALAFGHILNMQKPDGSFEYLLDFSTGKFISGNSIVRQAGVAYGLGEYYVITKDRRAKAPLEAAIQVLRAWSVREGGGLLVKGAERTRYEPTSGATALALLGALRYKEAAKSERFDDLIQDWKNGLAELYIENHGMKTSAYDERESPYYNGEAWLALAFYSNRYPDDDQVHALLVRLEKYLMEKYSSGLDSAFFHWGLMAASERYRGTGDDTFISFGLEQISKCDRDKENPPPYVEGAAELYSVLPDGDQKERLFTVLTEMKEKVFAEQQTGKTLPDGSRVHPSAKRYLGAFLLRPHEKVTRIDCTQHGLSAMLKLRSIMPN